MQDPNTIWVPPTASTSQQKAYFDAAFDPFFRVNQVIIALDDSLPSCDSEATPYNAFAPMSARVLSGGDAVGHLNSGPSLVSFGFGVLRDGSTCTNLSSVASGLLTRDAMLAMLDLQELIAATEDSAGTVLDDICYKPIAGKGCLLQTPVDYFRSDRSIVSTLTEVQLQEAMDCRTISFGQSVRARGA